MTITFTLELPTGPGVVIARADLTFSGLDDSGPSYEVRIFFNRPQATPATPRTARAGFAGRFALLGHGGCFGEDGHCQVTTAVSAFDRSHPHQLAPATRIVTVTRPIRALIAAGAAEVLVTAVPVVRGLPAIPNRTSTSSSSTRSPCTPSNSPAGRGGAMTRSHQQVSPQRPGASSHEGSS